MKTCKFKDATGHRCHKQGHIAPVRVTSPPSTDRGGEEHNDKSYQGEKGGTNKWLDADEEDKDALVFFVLRGDDSDEHVP